MNGTHSKLRYRPARWSCQTEVVLRAAAGEIPAVAQTASSTGIGVSGASRLQQGSAVSVLSNGVDLPARVAWVSGDTAGLEFDTPQTRKTLVEAGLRQR